jgi:predicted RNA-binding Zn ribbon-like protein
MQIVGHTFGSRDLVGGHVVLDLVNTVTARSDDPIDWLDGFPRLLDWAELTGRFDQGALRALRRRSEADPRAAALALRHTRELREALLGVLTSVIGAEVLAAPALERLERWWKSAIHLARFDIAEGHVRLDLDVETSGIEYLNHELVLRTFDLLRILPVERTRICPGCGWVFIDRSKGGRRRWCDMATCGNAAKSRRHYQRTHPRGVGRHRAE